MQGTTRHTLPNGVVAFHNAGIVDHTTTLAVAVTAGTRDEPDSAVGITHVLEHVLLAAPVPGSDRSVTEAIDALGGECNAFTAKEALVAWARVPNAQAATALRLLADAICAPVLDAAVVEQERRVIEQELRAAAADPSDIVHDHFYAALFPDHPLGRPAGGTLESVRALSFDAIRELHPRLVTASTTQVVMIGGDDRALLAALADSPVAALGQGERGPRTVPGTVGGGSAVPPLADDADYPYLCLGGAGAARRSAEWPAHEVLHHLLGPSANSLLYRRLRNALGAAYQLYSWHTNYSDCGAWRVMVGTEPELVDDVVAEVRTVVEDVARHGAPGEALAAAKAQAVGRLLITWEDPVQHAQELALGWYAPDGGSPLDAAIAAVRRTTVDEVAKAAARLAETFTVAAAPTAAGPS